MKLNAAIYIFLRFKSFISVKNTGFKISGYFDGSGGCGAGEEDWCKWKNVLYVI